VTFLYDSTTGKLFAIPVPAPPIGIGYSGFNGAKNNPGMESVHDVGPIPRGTYEIGAPFDSPEHGPLAMPLTPCPGTDTFGRSGFLMHGDSLEHPGEASHGCIIMPRDVREHVARARGLLGVV